MNFKERMKCYENKRKENVIGIAMGILANEQAICTFTPRVNSCKHRNLKQFLQDQEKFLANKSTKIKSFKQLLMKQEIDLMRASSSETQNSKVMKRAKSRLNSTQRSNIKTDNKSRNDNIHPFITDGEFTKRTKDEINKNKREKTILKTKLGKELNTLFNIHNPHKNPISFSVFCIVKICIRYYYKSFWNDKKSKTRIISTNSI